MTASVDVVVPTHDGWELTERCLVSLQGQTLPHAVIVTDNASAGLAKLNEQVKQLGGAQQNMQKFGRQTDDLSRKIKGLSEATTGVTKAISFFTAGWGAAGAAVAAFSFLTDRGLRSLNEYSKKLIDLGTAAQSIGIRPGALREITETFERAGTRRIGLNLFIELLCDSG